MSKPEEYRFFLKPLLKEANEAAHREKRSRCIDPRIIESLKPDLYLVDYFTYHKKGEIRLRVLLNDNQRQYLDVSELRFQSLPVVRYNSDGTVKFRFNDRPYPNGREWKETVVTAPVRKQSQFRKNVLKAYGNCCALCMIKDTQLLRAAHIWDVKDGGPDCIKNGISLCVNHEIAFDKGVIRINPDYTVMCPDNINVLVDKLKLPVNVDDYPSKQYIEKKNALIDATK